MILCLAATDRMLRRGRSYTSIAPVTTSVTGDTIRTVATSIGRSLPIVLLGSLLFLDGPLTRVDAVHTVLAGSVGVLGLTLGAWRRPTDLIAPIALIVVAAVSAAAAHRFEAWWEVGRWSSSP